MDKITKEILLKEIKNFKQISQEYNYKNIKELVGHYIEEGIINSKEDLTKTVALIKNKLGIDINIRNFNDCWSN
jgi:hypothetical protein